jgi:tripartite-type tricarboxylate transporter receptor subunit TctC
MTRCKLISPTRRHMLASLAASLVSPSIFAQGSPSYPAKPITWIVPFAAGGGLDILARPIAMRASAF